MVGCKWRCNKVWLTAAVFLCRRSHASWGPGHISDMKSPLPALGLLALVLTAGVGIGSVARRSVTLHNGWKVSPAGAYFPMGDMMAGGAVSPDGRRLAFVSVGQGMHKLHLVDAAKGAHISSVDLGPAWFGMVWRQNSRAIHVSGGSTTAVLTVEVGADGRLVRKDPAFLDVPKRPNGSFPPLWLAGMAWSPSQKTVWMASHNTDALIEADPATGRLGKTIVLPEDSYPYDVQLHQGRLYASLMGQGRVIEADPIEGKVLREFRVGEHPNELKASGGRLFVSCGNEDTIHVVDLETGERMERISTRPWPDAPAGSTPCGISISPDGKRMLAANADNNCAALIDISKPGRSRVMGFIPTAAYPTATAFGAGGRLLFLGSGKGFGTGPNGSTDKIHPEFPAGYPYIVTLLNGGLSVAASPDEAALARHTQSVMENSKYKPAVLDRPAGARAGSAIPVRLGDSSPIKHVLYIIKENRTYDQLFGDLTRDGRPIGNGDPKLTLFGESVAPNHRAIAREFALFDNLYCDGEVSVDGHHWSNAAYVPYAMQRVWPQQYSGKGGPRYSARNQFTPSRRIWDACRRAGVSFRTYYYHTSENASQEWAEARRAGRRDYDYVDIFLEEFREFEKQGTMPQFMVMALSEDHTRGSRAGAFTPKACVASNDIAVGKVVEAISRSSLWSKFAIFIIQDDAQNGPDHVDAHRTVALVASPYIRRGIIDSTHYTTCSMLRTMELILGLPPLSQHDAAATAMHAAFTDKPDLRPYTLLKPLQDTEVKNPPAQESRALRAVDYSEPDQLTLAQEIHLNMDIWKSVKGSQPYPGAVRRYGVGSVEGDDD